MTHVIGNVLVLVLLASSYAGAPAREQYRPAVSIVTGEQPGELERFAATELQSYVKRLYGIEAVLATARQTVKSDVSFPLGSPDGNEAVRQVAHKDWPALSAEGFLIRRVNYQGRPAWILGGNSEIGTLWAAYDLMERLGVVYTLDGDILPDPSPFRMPELDVKQEPLFPFRSWRVWNIHAMGPESWGIQEQKRVIDQLVKMKFNAVLLHLWPFQPLVHYEFRGIEPATGDIFFGLKYPLGPDTIGADKFGNASEFQNPDFAGTGRYQERLAAGRKLIHGILAYAKSRGMKTVIAFSITWVPIEIARHLAQRSAHQAAIGTEEPPKPQQGAPPLIYRRHGNRFYGTDPRVNTFSNAFDPVVQELAKTVMQAHFREYPEADYYAIGSSEQRDSVAGYEQAWELLDQRYQLEKDYPLNQLLAHARGRFFHNPGRAERELKGDIEFLYLLDKLFNQDRFLEKSGNTSVRMLLEGDLQDELYPILPRILPGFGFLAGIDYTLSLSSDRFDLFSAFKNYPVTYRLTLNDDNNVILVQYAGTIVQKALEAMRRYGVRGYMVRFWLLGNIDPDAAYVSAASWDAGLTAVAFHRRRFQAICGEEALPEIMEAFQVLEEATRYTDTVLGVAFPMPYVVKRRFESDTGVGEKVAPAIRYFDRARDLFQRAGQKSRPAGREYLDYFEGRLECGSQFMRLVQIMEQIGSAYREALSAKVERNVELAYSKIAEIEALSPQALAFSRACLQAHGRVARDQSDRGLLAVMNHYVHRYVQAQLHILELETSTWEM